MVNFWTIQKSAIVDEVFQNGIYKPDFSKSSFVLEMPQRKDLYDFILNCFNTLNGTDCSGLVFCFAGYDVESASVVQLPDIDAFLDCMQRGRAAIKALLKIFEEGDYKLLHLRRELNFKPVTIDMNDFQLLMPPILILPPYDKGYLDFLTNNLARGVVTQPLGPSGIMQMHLPDIRKQDVVEIFEVPRFAQ